MDPLSHVLSLLKPRSYVSDSCWVTVSDIPEPVPLNAGDCFLLPRGISFCLTTNLDLTPVDFRSLMAEARQNSAPQENDGKGCFIAGGHFLLTGAQGDTLLRFVLPTIVHIRSESGKEAMRWSLERMKDELHHPQPGSALVAQQLAYMMLVQALRLHMAEGVTGGVGWLFALADKQMCAAITSMHDNPSHRWTLGELAERAGMSRSIFAQRFKQTVGATAMEYLTRWRMLVAEDRLDNTEDSISQIAASLGYDSESAFGKAFRRVMGSSPRKYSRKQAALPSSPPEPKVA